MELTLTHHTATRISVTCDGQFSHRSDLRPLLLKDEKVLIDNPVLYGQKLYEALFPPDTAARRALALMLEAPPGRILLVTADSDLDAIPWEYTYGPNSFLVQECHFVRGLPAEQRIVPPAQENDLHIVAIPSNPLSHDVEPLNIEGEWMRLKEIIEALPYALTLERTRPPSLERVRQLVANQKHRIVHFMGHGGQDERGAFLCFEQENGDLDLVTARQLIQRVRSTVFLVTLNACASATPGETHFSNLAAALVQQKTPYALGMCLSIPDEDARTFSRTFYSELARGSSVEEALLQARFTLANSPRPWVVGVPVLYTALAAPAAGFTCITGTPTVNEDQPRMEVSALPRAEGVFQGRIEELKQLGTLLTGDDRPPLVTIHGGGGQGKTALAREAIEHFAYAWPGGVWTTTLENLPSRITFVTDLARFLGIATQEILDPKEVERQVLTRLMRHRTLIVLDNAETLTDAVEMNKQAAVYLAQFIREQLPHPQVSLLATSRSYLGWGGEIGLELSGLTPIEGTQLFLENAPRRRVEESHQALARGLSEKVEGHPLSLRLLGSAFNASTASLATFVKEYEGQLLKAENRYKEEEHRQRTLYASLETSVRFLDRNMRSLLSGLWVFHAPFLPETAVAIFDPRHEDAPENPSPVRNRIYTLWQRGLLALEAVAVHGETLLFYHVLPTTRPYLQRYMEQAYERNHLLRRFGTVHSHLVDYLYEVLDSSATAVAISQEAYENFERGIEYVTGLEQGYYLLHWGWIVHRLGNPQRGLKLLEHVLEIAQGHDQLLELKALDKMANLYVATGRQKQALAIYEQILPLWRGANDRVGESGVLANMGEVYRAFGQPQRALEHFEQALSIARELHHVRDEAAALSNIATVYQDTGQPKKALELYAQALQLLVGVGDRTAEAAVLSDIGLAYQKIGQSKRALESHEQSLTIRHEMGDRAGEAVALNNIGEAYRALGQTKRALEFYEQALPIAREVHNTAVEAGILNNISEIYYTMGQIKQALELNEQILPLRREVGDRAGEARTLDNMALLFHMIGQPRRALKLYEQVLPLRREVVDRAGEANTLTNMGGVYQAIGELKRALEAYEQALPIRREVGDLAGEADTLCRAASVWRAIGHHKRALELYEQALSIYHQVNNRAEEARVLANQGIINYMQEQFQQALELYEQALSIYLQVNDRISEATMLNNMAVVYSRMGQPQRALELYEQALPIHHELGRRASEAGTLINMAISYREIEQPQRALVLLEQALPIMREVEDRAGEAAALTNMATVLYQQLDRSHEAIARLTQAIDVLAETDLHQDAAGHTVDDLQQILSAMQHGIPLDTLTSDSTTHPAANIQQIITQTIAVMTVAQDRHAEWREKVVQALQKAYSINRPQDAELFNAILALLDGRSPTLPTDHPYAQVVAEIQAAIPKEGLPFATNLVSRSIAALQGNSQEKMKHMQYLTTLDAQTSDAELKTLIKTIQLALFGGDLLGLGQNLRGVYRLAWETITNRVKAMQEEDNTITALQAGKPFIEGKTSWEEAINYSWAPDHHLINLFFRNHQFQEEEAVRSGKADFALVVEQDIIFLLFRFHGAHQGQPGIDWSDAPYTWHLLPAATRRLPPTPQELRPEDRARLDIVLINANTGIVLVIREVSLSHEFTVQLYQAIRAQASRPFDQSTYERQLEELYAKYPDSKDLLPLALVRCEDEA